ncbi:MAG: triose-phosphate isomerase [Candidatus Omnitrophota bacterium]|nr:triose-phosphate isomerase [Candidatus Omnitrophota bacterium]
MRKPLIAGNWKMFKTVDEAINLTKSIKAGVYKVSDCDVVICPPFTALAAAAEVLKGGNIGLGAQNMFPETEGAYTGEISPIMIKELSCRYVILGHSERRQYFSETSTFINQKVKLALKYNLIPILCIGETLEERESNRHFEVVKEQFDESLADISAEEVVRGVIAYEPVWAIGTGKTASPEQAEQMHSYVRRLLNEKFGQEAAERVNILYGGSVKADNALSLMRKANVDGALVGGASLKAEAFAQIVQAAVDACSAEANK